ncbi:MAG TPA: hypothetical protein VK181_04520 [Rhizobium sp.]|nr:hypothetical protein [Rhizobium sp.]
MECTILKSFPLSRDGVKNEALAIGDVVDVPDGLVDGLVSAGYVAKGASSSFAAPEPVVGEPGGFAEEPIDGQETPASEEPVVGEPKAAGGKARQSKDHQVQ